MALPAEVSFLTFLEVLFYSYPTLLEGCFLPLQVQHQHDLPTYQVQHYTSIAFIEIEDIVSIIISIICI